MPGVPVPFPLPNGERAPTPRVKAITMREMLDLAYEHNLLAEDDRRLRELEDLVGFLLDWTKYGGGGDLP